MASATVIPAKAGIQFNSGVIPAKPVLAEADERESSLIPVSFLQNLSSRKRMSGNPV